MILANNISSLYPPVSEPLHSSQSYTQSLLELYNSYCREKGDFLEKTACLASLSNSLYGWEVGSGRCGLENCLCRHIEPSEELQFYSAEDIFQKYDFLLRMLWAWLRHFPNEHLPSKLDDLLEVAVNVNTDGLTLLHFLAIYSHPRPKNPQMDIMRRIAEIVMQKSCWSILQSDAETDISPLDFAVGYRNISVMNVLLEGGAVWKV